MSEIGPIFRAISHRKGAFSLVVLELAASFTVVACLLLTGRWYENAGKVHSCDHEAELIEVTAHRPARGATAAETEAAAQAWQRAMHARLASAPDVTAVARIATTLLDQRAFYPSGFVVEPVGGGAMQPAAGSGMTVRTDAAVATVLGLKTLEGKLPASGEEGVVVLTRCLRDALFPKQQPAVGRLIAAGDLPPARVVAVVDDLYLRPPFVVNAQCLAFHMAPNADERDVRFLLRVPSARRDDIIPVLRRLLNDDSPGALTSVMAYQPENQRHRRITRGLVLTIALVGVNIGLVALIGALAVSSFLVAERTRQIGVRRALGATQLDIIRHFLIESSIACAFGIAAGLLCTMLFMLIMRRAYHSMTLDPPILALTAFILCLDATLAALLPALRAARIPPSVAARTL